MLEHGAGWPGIPAGESELKVARLEGFEPPTNGFGSHYSIRLSYRRLNQQLRKFSNIPLTTCPVTLETGILEHE